MYESWIIEKTAENIVYEHNRMYGTPKKLTIWLYHSKTIYVSLVYKKMLTVL